MFSAHAVRKVGVDTSLTCTKLSNSRILVNLAAETQQQREARLQRDREGQQQPQLPLLLLLDNCYFILSPFASSHVLQHSMRNSGSPHTVPCMTLIFIAYDVRKRQRPTPVDRQENVWRSVLTHNIMRCVQRTILKFRIEIGGSKVNVTMTLILPKILWKHPLKNMKTPESRYPGCCHMLYSYCKHNISCLPYWNQCIILHSYVNLVSICILCMHGEFRALPTVEITFRQHWKAGPGEEPGNKAM